jgi:hypothetical protein
MQEGDRWLLDMVRGIFVSGARQGLSRIFGIFGGGRKDEPPQPAGSPSEQALRDLGIAYRREPNGTLVVPGNIDLDSRQLTVLPDLSSVLVEGSFYCHNNQLTSLDGAPRIVRGSFLCDGNQLTSLAGAPREVGGNFWCERNLLVSLAGAPPRIGGIFLCEGNKLTSLEHAPQGLGEIRSDFGNFTRWEDVPVNLLYSPQTRARGFVDSVMALKRPVSLRKPFRFK